jgi:hypothetical protein
VDTVSTIIIPVAHYHRDIADRARTHAQAQTVPCEVLLIHDDDRRGAAWARNQGIARAASPFVTFLDADDTLDPTFVEKTFRRWLDLANAGVHYIFTDWQMPDGRARYAEESFDFFSMGMAHIITTLLPTRAARCIGGFDETMRGAGEEDEDFYARLHIAGMCHARVAEPLVEYHIGEGRSSTNATTNPHYAATVAAIEQRFAQKFSRYRGINMGCCGNPTPPQGQVPLNQPFENAVLVFALYTPRKEVGPATGIGYKRAGLGMQLYVHKDDVAARPDWWQPVPTVEALVPPQEDVLKAAGLLG